MIETIFDTLNAKAGIIAYEEYFLETGREKLPLFVRILFKYLFIKSDVHLLLKSFFISKTQNKNFI
jgi:hypothetical protein